MNFLLYYMICIIYDTSMENTSGNMLVQGNTAGEWGR